MKRYRITATPECTAILELLSTGADGHQVRITRHYDGWAETEESFMTHELFDMCLRTDYIREIDDAEAIGVA